MLVRVSAPGLVPATKSGGRSSPAADKFVRRKFGKVCKVLWPDKPDVEIAIIAEVEPRTARRWLRGEADPPWCVVRAAIDKMFDPIE